MPNLAEAGGMLRERAGIGGFKRFILRGNVVNLAIGVVIGATRLAMSSRLWSRTSSSR